LRSLIGENVEKPVSSSQNTIDEIPKLPGSREVYERNLIQLKELHHSQCLFNCQPPVVPGLQFRFDDSGALNGDFICNGIHQGYNDMVHGGVIAAIIDASMAQCLMGHGVVAYTAELSIKYRKPVLIHVPAVLKTSIVEISAGLLYTLKSEVIQNFNIVVQTTGKFFKVK
jgi:hypothetical protein